MFFASHLTVASRTVPTLTVLVSITGPSRKPDSSTQAVPVISPLPLSEKQPANTGSLDPRPRGRIAVTPVRTGPVPTTSFPSPAISVRWPTSTPLTSVMAFRGPGAPSNGTPKSRARGALSAPARGGDRKTTQANAAGSPRRIGDLLFTSLSFLSSPPARREENEGEIRGLAPPLPSGEGDGEGLVEQLVTSR